MNIKNIVLTLIIIIVIVAGGFAFYSYRGSLSKLGQNAGQNSARQISEASIEDKKISDQTTPFKIDITYPTIKGLDGFNKEIEDTINAQLADFKKNSLENDNAVKEIDPDSYAKYPRMYDMMVSYDKGEIDENVVSIVLSVYRFEGGAHGSTNFIAINYNPKTNSQIALQELFPGNTNYLKTISDFCIPNLNQQITERAGAEALNAEWINDGAGPKLENFSVFMVNKNSIVFYFPQYQVAAYAMGDFKVEMPR